MPKLTLTLQPDDLSIKQVPDVVLRWDDSGNVQLDYTEQSAALLGKERRIFAVNAATIQNSLLADGNTSVYLHVNGQKYHLWLNLFEPAKQIIDIVEHPDGAFVADDIISRVSDTHNKKADLKDFQHFLSAHGVKTKQTSLIKIILITVFSFIAVIIGLIYYLVRFYAT
jgi:hypothetical protein